MKNNWIIPEREKLITFRNELKNPSLRKLPLLVTKVPGMLRKCPIVTKVPHKCYKSSTCYESSLLSVTKVPHKCYKSSPCYESSSLLLQKKFLFYVTKVPIPMALSLSLPLSLFTRPSSSSSRLVLVINITLFMLLARYLKLKGAHNQGWALFAGTK